jgi:hypothetical protein
MLIPFVHSYNCHMCTEVFQEFPKLNRHCKEVHKTLPMVKCVCNKFLSHHRTVQRHIVRHDTTQGFM